MCLMFVVDSQSRVADSSAAQTVRAILSEASELDASAKNMINYTKTSKEYRYLEEMLTRLLLRLDGVDTGGSPEIRTFRREAVNSVQAILDRMEQRAVGP